ncbi:hypothetical protein LTT66_07305 [Nocardia gipuzkoensis]|uniref:hypothetical protein n=1 Tax=Nocardia gipuzkoensis TaxID=2749991 RepID=UPI001E63025B|nr:hypothetical protein [Nocardia gipuzkoensis]UGT69970.1 hypothetical protein LTT66_07305 [Nocardia gipuzkoensis]
MVQDKILDGNVAELLDRSRDRPKQRRNIPLAWTSRVRLRKMVDPVSVACHDSSSGLRPHRRLRFYLFLSPLYGPPAVRARRLPHPGDTAHLWI